MKTTTKKAISKKEVNEKKKALDKAIYDAQFEELDIPTLRAGHFSWDFKQELKEEYEHGLADGLKEISPKCPSKWFMCMLAVLLGIVVAMITMTPTITKMFEVCTV